LKFSRSIFLYAIIFCFNQAINAQGDFLKKYFPKDEANIVKMHKLSLENDSAKFFEFANFHRAKAISEKNYSLLCCIYARYAGYYFLADKISNSMSCFDSIAKLIRKEKLPDYNYYSLYQNRGTIKYQTEDYSGALSDYKKFEEIILKYKVGDLGNVYSGMASLYVMAFDAENGKKYVYKAMPFVKVKKNIAGYVDLLKALGSVYYLEDEFKRCDSILIVAKKICKENNLIIDYAECLYDYANSLKSQRRFIETKSVFTELIQVIEEIGDSDWRLQVMLELTIIHLRLGDRQGAQKILLTAEAITPSETMPDIEKIDVYRNLAKIYDSLGLYKKSTDAFKKYMSISELGKSTKNIAKLNQLTNDYERKQDSINTAREKEFVALANLHEQEKAENQLRQQRIIIFVSIIGFIIVIVFSFTLIKANRNKEKANKEITFQKGLLAEKNKEITDSITYAQRIQYSLLPLPDYIDILLPQHFLLYQPKDIVSGDFYWVRQLNAHELFVAVADCTGHGVPGAMMSALSIQNLNELASQTRSPGKLLSLLNNNLKNTLNQEQEGFSKDGLDICLCKIDVKERKLTYSGANRSLQIFNELGLKQEIKATKTGIGGHTMVNQEYAENEVTLEKNELVIMSTDGFADQFGGNENKKITTKRFKDWIAEIFSEELKKEALEKKYNAWKGSNEQIDDVCVLGFKI